MKLDKKEVQCIAFYSRPHVIHEPWFKTVSSRKIIPYLPKKLLIERKPYLTQILTFFRGLFIPSAKIYLIEAAAIAPCVFFKRGKVICINSDTFFYNMKQASPLVRLYMKILLWRIDGFISTSKMMHAQAITQSSNPSVVVHPFMETKALLKIKPAFANDNICNIAGTRYTKGADILIETFQEYKKIKPKAKLFMLGDHDRWIKKIREAGGIAPGFVSINTYLKKCSLYINPARHEPFGVNIIEAMAVGIPPIVSKYCGAKDFVEKVDKRLVSSLNPKEIIKKIKWLKSDKKRYLVLSKKCKKIAQSLTKNKSNAEFKEKFLLLLKKI